MSTAPDFPESGWKVIGAEEAYTRWFEKNPPRVYLTPVGEWIDALRLLGPPADGLPAPNDQDLHVAKVPTTRVVATYLVVPFEYMIIVKDFAH